MKRLEVERATLEDKVQAERSNEEDGETFEEFIYRRGPAERRRRNHAIALNTAYEIQQTEEIKPSLPDFAPFPEEYKTEEITLLEALEEEPETKDPRTICDECCKRVSLLKERGILDRYILSEAEAAVLCAFSFLFESGFDFRVTLLSCKEKPPSKLMVLIMRALRKLPQYRGTLYFLRGSDEPAKEKKKNELLRCPFCVSSSYTTATKDNSKRTEFKEVFRVEDGWGYDVSDFILREDEIKSYCKTTASSFILLTSIHVAL